MKIIPIVVLFVVMCKPKINSTVTSLRSGDDNAKISVNYLGDDNCRAYLTKLGKSNIEEIITKNLGLNSHLLDGKDGELMTETYRLSASYRNNLRLSGDRFFARNPASPQILEIEHIEENCRRLLLSVDAVKPPTMTIKHGFIAQDQQKKFQDDFVSDRFGQLNCADNFCTFSKINNGKRYFAYLEPASAHNDIVFALTYCPVQESCTNVDQITLKNIRFRDNNRYRQTSTVPPVTPTVTPEVSSHSLHKLFIRWVGSPGTDLSQLASKPMFRVILKNIKTGQLLPAVTEIFPKDSKKRYTSFKIDSICQLLAVQCQQFTVTELRPLLFAADLEIIFEFWHKGSWAGGSQRKSQRSVKIVPELINGLLQRDGTITFANPTNEWRSEFAFDNTGTKYLWLQSELSLKSSGNEDLNFGLRLRDRACKTFQTRGEKYRQDNRYESKIYYRYTVYGMFDRDKLNKHFNKCLGTNNWQNQTMIIDLVVKEKLFSNDNLRYEYTLSPDEVNRWFQEIGGVEMPRRFGQRGRHPEKLFIGFQSR